ncbi:protein arginine N-methyltransferase 1-like isoform X1 [Drosophila pseudoobscura]|uniref:Protein arginine N-methyltransferase 1-like isoform X1 n=1 Tax=Drosophila pseudoobscura pseudoobscura TaxID=46245 RepID=B5DKS7_DROPS|nr:protein arginine N-methyltransferase 1 isoform X1 [Drosophila pseudoobscura]
MERFDRQITMRALRHEFLRQRLFGAAMIEDSAIFRDANVLNIFCGDGGVAMLAIQAGARHVLAIDTVTNANMARRVIRKNGMLDRISVMGIDVRQLDLSGLRYDVLLCAWMDDMAIFQGKLSDLIVARDRFIRPGGIIYPYMIRISACAIEDGKAWEATNKWINANIGFRYLHMRELLRPVLDYLKPEQIVTSFSKIADFNLYTITLEQLNRAAFFSMVTIQEAPVHSICTSLESLVMRPGGPVALNFNHFTPDYRHTIFYLGVQLNACPGSVIVGKLTELFDWSMTRQMLKWDYEYNGRNGKFVGSGNYTVR